MYSRYRRTPGRSYYSTFEGTDAWWRRELLPRGWFYNLYDVAPTGSEPEETVVEETPREEATVKPLKVKGVDLKIDENTSDHHTDVYEVTKARDDGEQQLVVRRGDEFQVAIKLDRNYSKETDHLRVILDVGETPVVSKGTSVVLNFEKGTRARHWSAAKADKEETGETLNLRILSPPTALIGKWRLRVESKLRNPEGEGREVLKYEHKHPIYLIFNPYNKDDAVYMENEDERDEYVMNDSGKIYSGNYKQIGSKPWEFGQFEDFMLDCCMYLLEQVDLKLTSWGDPVAVCRAISAIVNSSDDNGVLTGNWSGKYDGGTPPTHWVGSVAILEEYWEKKASVKFGQCWVFSGVTTTVSRALGIPTRSVTNFASAHDVDGSISIDYHWTDDGEPIEERNWDSVWNFHVWNEAWMSRPDLTSGYGGWQAFDATPQETSGGVYCAGPCSLHAIKQGNVSLPYDAPFIFAEVNADKVHWILGDDDEYKTTLQKNAVGKRISTKRPRKIPRPASVRWTPFKEDKDRLEVTDLYKYKEGSEAERTAVYRANRHSTRPNIYDFKEEDVKFELHQQDDILVGNPFDVVLKVQNKSRSERNVHVLVTLTAVYYTGVFKAKVKSKPFDLTLGPIKGEEAILRVTAEEYLHLIVDQVAFKINVLAKVAETNQIHADNDDFRLRRPDLELKAPETVKVGQEFECLVKFTNSMPINLTDVEWMVEGAGIQRPKRYKEKELGPYDTAELKVTLKAKRAGERQVLASLTSKELMDVTGSCDVSVVE